MISCERIRPLFFTLILACLATALAACPPPPPCGHLGERCCDGSCLVAGLACSRGFSSSECVTCGRVGEPCCGGTTCGAGLLCEGSTCTACGIVDHPCCGTTCNSADLVCSLGRCTRCGSVNTPCCGRTCAIGAECVDQFFGDPQCVAAECGRPHQRCCGGSQCGAPDLACSGGECLPCGDAGQPCCSANVCAAGNDCVQATHQCTAHLPIGQPCTSDADCGGGGLECDHSVEGGMCTRGCNAPRDATCGPGTICSPLRPFTDASGTAWGASCLVSCDARDRASPAVCRNAFVCGAARDDGFSFSMNLRAVCFPFCSIDPECPPGLHCNPRRGVCGREGLVISRAADGEECDLADPAACRGQCMDVGGPAGRGLCGSFIDRTFTTECPDDPTMPIFDSGPELGLCLHRNCTSGCECPAGLVCSSRPELFDACTYAGSNPDLESACVTDGGTDAATDASDATTD